MRGAAKEFCQFAGAPQELFALMRCERVRGGRGLGEGNGWVDHLGREEERRGCSPYGTVLMGDNTARSQTAIIGGNTKVVAQLSLGPGPIRCQSQVPSDRKTQ